MSKSAAIFNKNWYNNIQILNVGSYATFQIFLINILPADQWLCW